MAERFGKGSREKIGRLNVLHLRGTPFERGFQHGSLLRYRIKDTLAFYRKLILKLAVMVSGNSRLRRRSLFSLNRLVSRRLARGFSDESLEEIRGLAVGVGVSTEDIIQALVLPDVLQYAGKLSQGLPRARVPLPEVLGCTSVLRESAGNSLFFGRNLDFWGAGHWDSSPAVIFHHPDRGKAYCSIASAGIPLAGVTALNQDGLVVAVHQHGSLDSSFSGTPIFELVRRVTANAATVDQALEIVESLRPTGGWSLVLASRNPLDAAVLEMSSGGKSLRRISEHSLLATNRFLDHQLASREIPANIGSVLSDRARRERAAGLLRQLLIKPAKMADILADSFDPIAGRQRSVGFTISRISTVSSAIFNVHSSKFYVSEATAPACKGGYVGFELEGELEGKGSGAQRMEVSTALDSALTSARELYIEASKEYLRSGDTHRILTLVGQCAKADPSEPNFLFIESLFRLKAGNHKGALLSLESALELETVEVRKELLQLWKARVHDLAGRREESRRIYAEVMEKSSSGLLKKKASSGLKKGFSEAELMRTLVDFTNADTFG